ncbi:hypothetical protein L873DRAFT_1237330 [Choiromyces venosus 120613-1]|uniref:Uncharacterized protein n=1 Tax=Choiromyces venosus 120613-1 TaxID=1336337 RepID=A0A3N4JH69_9PEZI|nr:hypothetical protein L873DRAFT_1237330 [Choiromyces venosus 120613-1]
MLGSFHSYPHDTLHLLPSCADRDTLHHFIVHFFKFLKKEKKNMTDEPRQSHCPPANSAFDPRTTGLAIRAPFNIACALLVVLLPDKNASPYMHSEHVGPSQVSNISNPRPPLGSPSNSHEPKPWAISDQWASAFESPLPPPLPYPIRLMRIIQLQPASPM